MQFKGYRLEIVIITVIVALLFFFGAQDLYTRFRVEDPVREDLIKVEGVKDIRLVEEDEGIYIQVKFSMAEDFLKSYNLVSSIAKEKLGREYRGIILDIQKPDELKTAIHRLQFPLYHTLLTGDVKGLSKDLQEIKSSLQLDVLNVQLDPKGIFIQIRDGEEEYYQVIPWLKSDKLAGGGGDNS